MHTNFTQPIKQANTAPIKAVIISAFFVALLITGGQVLASGKPVGKKRLFIIPAAAYFFNSTYWDRNGDYKKYDNNTHFGSTILSVNVEYGFSRRLSLLATMPFVINKISQAGYSTSVSGFGDAELGARYYVANINYNVYFSVQGNLVVPLYSSADGKSLGYGKLGTDIRAIGAGDISILSQKFYWEINTGFRQYLGDSGPFQLKNSLSLAYTLNKKSQVSVAGTSVYSFSDAKNALNVTNPLDVSNTKDFNFNQLTGSYSYSLKRNKTLFFSLSKFITGKNTGAGTTISVGYVYKY
ncbi:hypothetical protein BDD43_2370 [Mucilaginibacter gracilis]|uniref:Uncharacterized protein n=1 Tax=Mucilaginibacter gracilis TaxID=423350 RepID=A0A495J2F9_9SPHI|nr:hypothetical protein [Mucilaginibacter gracilis]RKR82199.1 hypothetical protein BDD43_2370 [Mucilaginibacter gracilis]